VEEIDEVLEEFGGILGGGRRRRHGGRG